MAKLPFQDIIKPLQAAIDDFALGMDNIAARIKEIEQAHTQTGIFGEDFARDQGAGPYKYKEGGHDNTRTD